MRRNLSDLNPATLPPARALRIPAASQLPHQRVDHRVGDTKATGKVLGVHPPPIWAGEDVCEKPEGAQRKPSVFKDLGRDGDQLRSPDGGVQGSTFSPSVRGRLAPAPVADGCDRVTHPLAEGETTKDSTRALSQDRVRQLSRW